MRRDVKGDEELDRVFAALAHGARRHILLLLSHLGGELPSGYLAKRFGHSWPTTTRHLGVLERAGLVTVRREGRGALYRLNRERLLTLVPRWLQLMEPPATADGWISGGPRTTAGLRNSSHPLEAPHEQRRPQDLPRHARGR